MYYDWCLITNCNNCSKLSACRQLFSKISGCSKLSACRQLFNNISSCSNISTSGKLFNNISGCINSCGHHHSGHLGILGVDKDGSEWYQVSVGGSDGSQLSGTATPGKIIGPAFAVDEVPDVVEAVIEDEALKTSVFRELDRHVADPTAILASNTSSIPIMKLGIATQRPEHPFIVWEPFDGAVPGRRRWTYAEFAADVASLAASLAGTWPDDDGVDGGAMRAIASCSSGVFPTTERSAAWVRTVSSSSFNSSSITSGWSVCSRTASLTNDSGERARERTSSWSSRSR